MAVGRMAATAPTGPLAWELPYTSAAALKKKKSKENKNSAGISQCLYTNREI